MNLLKCRGFTLIELLTVIAIIGILAGIIVVAVQEPRKRSRDAKRIADLKSMKSALEMYYDKNQKFPSARNSGTEINATNVVTCGNPPSPSGCWNGWAQSNLDAEWGTTTGLSKYLGSFINPLPKDPLNDKRDVATICGNNGACVNCQASVIPDYPLAYIYRTDDGGQNFKLMAKMESLCDGISDGGTSSGNSVNHWYEVWGGIDGNDI